MTRLLYPDIIVLSTYGIIWDVRVFPENTSILDHIGIGAKLRKEAKPKESHQMTDDIDDLIGSIIAEESTEADPVTPTQFKPYEKLRFLIRAQDRYDYREQHGKVSSGWNPGEKCSMASAGDYDALIDETAISIRESLLRDLNSAPGFIEFENGINKKYKEGRLRYYSEACSYGLSQLYLEDFMSATSGQRCTNKIIFDGKQFISHSTIFSNLDACHSEHPGKILWQLATLKSEAHQSLERIAKFLFSGLLERLSSFYKSELSPSLGKLKAFVKEVALLEWINARRFRFDMGSAGVSHIMTRALLDAAGIRNSHFRINLCPNMEAFITTAKDYVEHFPYFFAEALEFVGINRNLKKL